MRITNKMMADAVQRNLQRGTANLARLQNQLASGKRLRQASDDPAAVARALALRRNLVENDQYLRNIEAARGRLAATDAALQQATDVIERALILAEKGANDALGAEEMAAIAEEADELLYSMLQVANGKNGDEFMFGGYVQAREPFALTAGPPATVVYQGDAGVIRRSIGQGIKVVVNVAGEQVFGPAFAALIRLRDDLTAGDHAAVRARLDELWQAGEAIGSARAEVGARVNRLQQTAVQLTAVSSEWQAQLSRLEDTDIAEATVAYATGETIYKVALATAGKLLQTSLIDYLR